MLSRLCWGEKSVVVLHKRDGGRWSPVCGSWVGRWFRAGHCFQHSLSHTGLLPASLRGSSSYDTLKRVLLGARLAS